MGLAPAVRGEFQPLRFRRKTCWELGSSSGHLKGFRARCRWKESSGSEQCSTDASAALHSFIHRLFCCVPDQLHKSPCDHQMLADPSVCKAAQVPNFPPGTRKAEGMQDGNLHGLALDVPSMSVALTIPLRTTTFEERFAGKPRKQPATRVLEEESAFAEQITKG